MITIRPLALQDAPAVFAAVDRSRGALDRWMDWYHAGYSLTDATTWVSRSVAESGAGTAYHFAVCDDAGRLLGVVSLEDVTPNRGRAMLGYWVASPVTGLGIGTEAVGQALAWTFSHTEIEVIWARIAHDNVASWRVAEANGLRLRPPDSTQHISAQLIYEVNYPRGPTA